MGRLLTASLLHRQPRCKPQQALLAPALLVSYQMHLRAACHDQLTMHGPTRTCCCQPRPEEQAPLTQTTTTCIGKLSTHGSTKGRLHACALAPQTHTRDANTQSTCRACRHALCSNSYLPTTSA